MSSYQNLLRFVRVNFLILFVGMFYREIRNPDGTISINLWSIFASVEPSNLLNVSLVPGWIPHTLAYLLLLKVVVPLGLMYGMKYPERRFGFVAAFILLFCTTAFEHVTVSVLSSFSLIPMLLLSIEPPQSSNEKRVRGQLAVAYSSMYLLSALAKVNGNFLSGAVLEHQNFTWLLRSTVVPLFQNFTFVLLTSWLGIALQFLASSMCFARTRKKAMIASLLFHAGICITIVWSMNLLLICSSLILLFNTRMNLQAYYRTLVYITISYPVVLFLAAPWGRPFYDGVSIAIALVVIALQFIEIARIPHPTENFFSIPGFAFPAAYFLSALILVWPEPLGYSQYSGREQVYYAIKMKSVVLDDEKMRGLRSTWSVRYHFDSPTEWTVFLPSASVVKPFLERICSLSPEAQYLLFTTSPIFPSREDLRRISDEVRDLPYVSCRR